MILSLLFGTRALSCQQPHNNPFKWRPLHHCVVYWWTASLNSAINSSGTFEYRKNTLPPPTDGYECPTFKCNAKVLFNQHCFIMLPLLSLWDSFKKPSNAAIWLSGYSVKPGTWSLNSNKLSNIIFKFNVLLAGSEWWSRGIRRELILNVHNTLPTMNLSQELPSVISSDYCCRTATNALYYPSIFDAGLCMTRSYNKISLVH